MKRESWWNGPWPERILWAAVIVMVLGIIGPSCSVQIDIKSKQSQDDSSGDPK